jgi:hypothetical protein
MDRINISHACLSSVPPLGCEEFNCSECDPTQVKHPYCHEDQVIGCFMALHVQCGVVCRQVQVEDCYPGECVQEDSLSAMCKQPQTDNTPCDMFSCENCPGEEPGTGACDTPDRLIKCLVSPYPGAIECENLCTLITQDCPEGQQCQEDGQTAFCSP